MNPPAPSLITRLGRVLLWMLLGALFFTPIAINIRDHVAKWRSTQPDEKTAILQALASKFAGPSYFQSEGADASVTSPGNRVYISNSSAVGQMDRIVAQRHFTPEMAVKMKDLIARLTEPAPSRAMGEERVNLLMLNISLDALQ
jgi:hypothetical protein